MFLFESLPSFEGTFDTTAEKLEKFTTDFGRIVKTRPIGVLHPASAEDVIKMVRYCRDHNLKVIPRGMSHSAFGQCQCDGGVVINMPAYNRILAEEVTAASKWIDVAGGILWNKLIRQAGSHGLGPPVTTDWQQLSVGGTISTGGVGFMSYKWGIQADHILEMDVVTGEGELVTCSPDVYPDLFDAVRGGLGQYGIAVRIRIPLVKTPDTLHVYQVFATTSRDFHAGIERATASRYFDCIHAFVIPNERESISKKLGETAAREEDFLIGLTQSPQRWIYYTELVKYDGNPQQDEVNAELALFNAFGGKVFSSQDNFYNYITKEPPLIVTEREKGKTSHPEITLAHPASKFVPFMDHFLRDLNKEDMADGPILIIPVDGTKLKTPLFKAPAENQLYFIGILRNAYPDTDERIRELTAKNMVCYEDALAMGGNRYACDSIALPDSPASWKTHYGPELWKQALTAKRRYDPHNLFVSNLNIFPQKEPAIPQ